MSPTFSDLPPASPDPVFELMRQAREAGSTGINATVGMILSEEGLPLIFESVQKAAREWAEEGLAHTLPYPPLLGLPTFRELAGNMITNGDTANMASLATTGGTGAVTMNLLLLKTLHPEISVILPTPTWSNHRHLCATAGLRAINTPYLLNGLPSVEGLLTAMENMNGPKALLLQADCHNPTGKDLREDQWETLAEAAAKHKAVILLDMPYQGFGGTPEHDARIVTLLRTKGVQLLVAWSGSKNHSMYGLRTGLACACGNNAAEAKNLSNHYAVLTRGIHSAAPTAGQWIIARVQEKHHALWTKEITRTREDINAKRAALRELLPADYSDALDGHGMYALLPLGEKRVTQLRTQHKIFLTGDGRINIAGLSHAQLEPFAASVSQLT